MRPPDEPDVPPGQTISRADWLRFEDVSQDGRVTLLGTTPSITTAIWRGLLTDDPWARSVLASGIVPILTRLVLTGGDGPITPTRPIMVHGRYELAATVDAQGAVDRLVFGAWTRLEAPRGTTYGPPVPGAGALLTCGRAYGEHVFTRLFAPPDQRRVKALDRDGAPWVPDARTIWRPPEAVLALPDGATPLDDALVVDDVPIRLSLAHTDPNQHVNSLVYPRLFEEAAIRRLAAHGHAAPLLGRACEVAFRKPSFAGDTLTLALRTFRATDGTFGAVGAFAGTDGDARPRVTLAIVLAP